MKGRIKKEKHELSEKCAKNNKWKWEGAVKRPKESETVKSKKVKESRRESKPN